MRATFIVYSLVLILLSACSPSGSKDQAEQPAPEQPTPEQPAPEQPVPQQPRLSNQNILSEPSTLSKTDTSGSQQKTRTQKEAKPLKMRMQALIEQTDRWLLQLDGDHSKLQRWSSSELLEQIAQQSSALQSQHNQLQSSP